uniref:Myosin IXb n=1 Tax=Esox lucius TaxID=8010 RepID=A0A6Q2XM50_ESOLU
MSVSDGTTGAARRDVDRQKQQDVVIPIYPRLSQETPACFHIQVSPGATAAMVIQFAVATLDLDVTRTYILLEVTQAGGGERRLGDTEVPGERVLLWPQRARKEHLQEEGYYFILQAQGGGGAPGPGADDVGVPSLEDYDDLCSLSPLTEDTILTTLRQRFYKRKIYTYASGILVAINPFKFLTIYNPKYVTMYYNQPLGKLSPHIFAVADAAYHTMLRQQENQCVVISGESGSGKTQSTNFLIHCLTALSQKGCSSGVERTILGAGPVLEAFGNARTAQNNNSSRFGKFIQVNYLESGVVRGAVIEKYLLEKCRLVFRDKSERNYHVFYYLLVGASPEEQTEFRLLQPEDYAYLQQENLHLEDAEDLRHEFKKLHQAMEMVGFLPPTRNQIFSVLSAILYLGNVTYSQSEDGQRLKAGPEEILSTLSHLLKVKQELLVQALTERKQKTANDTLVLHYTLKEAITARDSMAKTLYSSLFDWIVLHINHALLNRRDMEESVSCLSIGILDIFGFEDFRTNSFEQFCINYANEKLHYYFNQHIFSLEQEEYKAEGICWRTVEYTDNLGCIQLISQKPTGLFSLLDEESNLPQATDDTLLGKFKKQHQNNPYFISTPVMKPAFIIHHFAGMVQYQIQDFRKKNTDHMRPDIVALLRSSELAFMRQLIGSDPVAVFRWGILRATVRIIAAFNSVGRTRAATGRRFFSYRPSRCSLALLRLYSSMLDFSFDRSDDNPVEVFEDIFTSFESRKIGWSVRRFIDLLCLVPQNLINSQSLKHIVGLTLYDHTTRAVLHPHQRKKPPSISAQFQASLNKLLETVGRAEPFFIRCIRSNAEKKEMVFDDALVLQQLRYTGMLETVRVRKSGYSAKFTFKEFLEKFKVLLPKGATAAPEDIAKLLQNMGLRQGTYQIGKTKVFLKDKERQRLQDAVNQEVMRNIIILQRWFRACLVRNNFLYKKDAAIRIQRCWRAFLAGNRCRAATVIQVAWRGSQKRTDYLRKRNSVQKMQELLKNKQVKSRSKAEEENPTPPQLPVKAQTPPKLPPKPKTSPKPSPKPPAKHLMERRRSQERRELKKQYNVDHSPSRTPRPKPKVNEEEADPNKESDKRDGRGSPPSLNRPLSFPMDSKAGRFCGHYTSDRKSPLFLCVITPKHHSSSKATSPTSPYRRPSNEANGLLRKATICISRATRVSKQWNASLEREITDSNELRNLDEFLGNQVNELRTRGKELSATESIFLTATMHFRENIKSMYSISQKPQSGYKGLMVSYENRVSSLAGTKQQNEVQSVVNLFQSVLDGFIRGEIKRAEAGISKVVQNGKASKLNLPNSPLDHMFSTYQVNIMQSCDQCGSYIWVMEKAYMCSTCKLISHKKCLSKIRPCDPISVCLSLLCVLTSQACPIPLVVQMLLEHVEMNGLYTEGIYRKSGSACHARELHQLLETNPEMATLENYSIHTVTGLVKRWLRELPDPLMTYNLYNEFLQAVELPNQSERLRVIYQKVEGLPTSNFNTLERLLFHLVRVAKEEEHNRMSANSLAIVFAPCILRSPDTTDPFLGMKDVSKTTMCVEILITEQFRRYTEKMQDILKLEFAETLAVNQLKLKRQNTVRTLLPWPFVILEASSGGDMPNMDSLNPSATDRESERTLIERIKVNL